MIGRRMLLISGCNVRPATQQRSGHDNRYDRRDEWVEILGALDGAWIVL
jgi:hypothetical protein